MSKIALLEGDCLEYLRAMPDNTVDLTVTSPPYDNLRTYNNSLNDWSPAKWQPIMKELHRITKIGGVVVWVVGDATINGSETGTSFKQALWAKECGFNLHDTMIYRKNSLTFPDTNRYYQCFEYMFVFSKEKPKTSKLIADKPNKQANKVISGNYRDIDGSLKEMSGAKKKRSIKEFGVRWNIWEYNTGWKHSYHEDFLRGHPAIFPLLLAKDHILTWSNPGDLILDPFLGSGTTAVAAKLLNRDCIGIEREKEYLDIAKARLDSLGANLFMANHHHE